MKFLMALTTATVFVTSAFMQSAIAQKRTGNTYSQMGEDQASVWYQFSLVNKTKKFKSINDEAKNNSKLGIFRGAIENYQSGSGVACSTTTPSIYDDKNNLLAPCNAGTQGQMGTHLHVYFFDKSGFLILKKAFEPSTIGFNGDLYAELITNDPLFNDNTNTITYTIVKQGQTEPVKTYKLKLSGSDINQDKAINDLKYILEKDLFSKAITVLINSPPSSNYLFSFPNILLQKRFQEVKPVILKQP